MSPALRWASVLAVVALLALLLSFDRVVRQGVVDGGLRRAAALERSNAVWRCNVLADRQARANCRSALS